MHVEHISKEIVDEVEGVVDDVDVVSGQVDRFWVEKRLLLVDGDLDKVAGCHGRGDCNAK